MNKTNPDEQAFPHFIQITLEDGTKDYKPDLGLTKREFFTILIHAGRSANESASGLIEESVAWADALIRELNR